MPTQVEARSKYLETLKAEIDIARSELGKVREQLRLAQLEDDAQLLLTAAQRDALNQAKVIDRQDVSVLQAERDRLVTLVDALQALVDAVRQVS